MKDHLIRITTVDGTWRATAAVTTALVEEIRRRQDSDPIATMAIGRLATGAALLSSLLKDDQRLAIMVEGNGPLQKLHAETDARGRVRGALKVPRIPLAETMAQLSVAEAVGRAGFLHVVKDLGLKEPYRGMVQLVSSEIAEDLAYYLTTSEQIPSSVALGVALQEDGRVGVAGGFLIQALPPVDESAVALLEDRLRQLPSTTTLLREGRGPRQILEQLFAGLPFHDHGETALSFHCSCHRRQILQLLRALGRQELEDILANGEAPVVTCEYCGERYPVTREELAALLH